MRLIDNAKQEARVSALEKWHPWFAWHPVRVENHDIVWLERLERRCEYVSGYDGTYCFPKYRRPTK